MNSHTFISAYGSVIGLGHIQQDMPMQDACGYDTWDNGWGIAIICDGASSSGFAHIGAHLCVGFLITECRKVDWSTLIQDESTLEEQVFILLLNALEYLKSRRVYELESLSCTVNAVIFSQHSLISFHIGDGRAGYCDISGKWHALFRPHKGEEFNQTVFLTSQIWQEEPHNWLEVRVIKEPYKAFCVLSDGCENAAFECNQWNAQKEIYEDLNRPYSRFFDPLIQGLYLLYQQGKKKAEIQTLWEEFLRNGNKTLTQERDDKSLIIVCNLEQNRILYKTE
ncbi:MAG: protein phosphatase 2C domain-containing protein [Bacteroidia bacterium]|nr:protein phosphatase 2C domain-containing protein [Bacteroidia bacterium]MDW8348506.1 PP2C family serine/threonine-protein phosphatase [Bacteroidia bacterium]